MRFIAGLSMPLVDVLFQVVAIFIVQCKNSHKKIHLDFLVNHTGE